ncbi:MAG: pyridoxamine 5'-phosphate oxidase family protein [Pseudomonadota bacterium]
MSLKMTADEIEAFVDSKPGWVTLSTISRSGHPHSVPLGYFRDGRDLLMGVRDGTAKVRNVERDSRASIMLEHGSTMADIRGVLMQGNAVIHRAPDEVLHCMRLGATARGVPEAELPVEARPGSVFIRFTPTKVISWDYGKLAPRAST